MNITEIKKELYKQKPIANLLYIRKGLVYYNTLLQTESGSKSILFEIPVSDMGDADFTPTMDAKLLNRWISF